MKKREIFENMISNIMVFAVLAGPAAFFVNLLHGRGAAWMCLLLLPVFLLLYIMRLTIKSFWVFVPAHLAYAALSLFALRVDIFLFLIMLLFALAGVLSSFMRKIKGEPAQGETYLASGSLFCLASALLSSATGVGTEIIPLAVFLELVVIAGYLALNHMKKLDISLQTLSVSRPDMDNRHILRFNNALTAGFIFLTVSASGLVALMIKGDILGKILTFIIRAVALFILFIIKLVPAGNESAAPDEGIQRGTEALPWVLPGDEASWISQFIEKIILVMGTVIFLGLVVFIIWRLISLLYRSFGAKDDTDTEEKLERVSAAKRAARRARRRDFGRGYEKKIRKLYYKTVKRQKEIMPKNTDTTGDILLKSAADISALTKEYEKVRYGQ